MIVTVTLAGPGLQENDLLTQTLAWARDIVTKERTDYAEKHFRGAVLASVRIEEGK